MGSVSARGERISAFEQLLEQQGAGQHAQGGSGEGVALLTVHSSKGLEFDVVFLATAEGTFPDWRATGAKEQAEEVRNAFVAVTRSKRFCI